MTDFSFFRALNAAVARSRLFVVLPLVVGLAIGLWTFVQPRMYSAYATFVPQEVEGTTGSGAAIARQLGINIGAGGSGRSSEFYRRLLNSLSLLRETVEYDYAVRGDDGSEQRMNLVERWVEPSGGSLLPPWARAVERLRDQFSASVDPETGIIRLAVTSEDPELAEQIAQRMLAILIRVNIEVRQTRGEEEGRFLSARADEASERLRAAEAALKQFLLENREFGSSPELRFQNERLQRMVAIRQEVYISMLRLQEEARLQALRDTPPLTVLESPEGTAMPQPRGTILRTVLGFFLGFLLAIGIAGLVEYWKAKERSGDPEFHRFNRLVADKSGALRRRVPFLR